MPYKFGHQDRQSGLRSLDVPSVGRMIIIRVLLHQRDAKREGPLPTRTGGDPALHPKPSSRPKAEEIRTRFLWLLWHSVWPASRGVQTSVVSRLNFPASRRKDYDEQQRRSPRLVNDPGADGSWAARHLVGTRWHRDPSPRHRLDGG